MSSYVGRHAELYDLFYADKPYQHEAAFVVEQLRQHGLVAPARMLELACGTGRHAIEFEQLGFDVVALDYSEDMVRQAHRRATAAISRVDFRVGDMRELNLSGPKFDVAVCLFDSLGYVQSNTAIDATLRAIRKHVRRGGLFVFEFWHAGAMLRGYDPLRVRRWSTPTGEVLRISETCLDCMRQTSSVQYTVYELAADGRYSSFKETQTNRYFLLQEMDLHLSRAGWVPKQWFAGFTASHEISTDTWHVVGLAENLD